jgi:hypothetical protein
MSNIIKFPLKNKNASVPVISEEKIATDINLVKFNHINETLHMIVPRMFNDIMLAGFDVIPDDEDDDTNIKDNAMIVESLRALLCKHYGIKHPIQEVSEAFFKEEENGIMGINKSLNLELSEFERGMVDQAD